MHVAVDLLVHCVDDRGQVVAEVRAAETAGEVDVLAALDIPDACALGALDDEWGRGNTAGDVALPGLLHAIGGAPLLQRHGHATVYGRSGRSQRFRRKAADTMRPLAPWPSG